MTKREFEVVASIVASLSYHLKDGCFIVGDGNTEDSLLLEELHDTVDKILEKENKNYSPEKFWNAVYNERNQVIRVINEVK